MKANYLRLRAIHEPPQAHRTWVGPALAQDVLALAELP